MPRILPVRPPPFSSLSLDRGIVETLRNLSRNLHLSLHRLLPLFRHAHLPSLPPVLQKRPVAQLLVHRRRQRNRGNRGFPASLARALSLRLRRPASVFSGLLPSLRLLQPLPIAAPFAPSLPDSDSSSLSEAGTLRTHSRTHFAHAAPHAALLPPSRVVSRRGSVASVGAKRELHVFDVHDGGSVRGMHLRPRRVRLPLAAIAGRHAALLEAAAAEWRGRGDAAVAGNDRNGAENDGNDGGTAAEVL